jgi:ubiquitin carboxyl-terminal hydrolase L3
MSGTTKAEPCTAPWAPLDCSPSTTTNVAAALGVDVRKWRFEDVLGLEPELLALLPPCCCALILLYPTAATTEAHLRRATLSSAAPGDVIFVRQKIGGMCGTIAVLHALANNLETLEGAITTDSLLAKFVPFEMNDLSQEEIGKSMFKMLLGSKPIYEIHSSSAAPAGTRQGRHFITFVHSKGYLLELDGRREHPINRGPTSPETFLVDAAVEIRQLMATVNGLDSQQCFILVALVNDATTG